MAFTRKFLAALGIDADKVDEIISAHTEVTDALKQERDKYQADADKLAGVQQELDTLKASADGVDAWEEKYNALKQEFDSYKADKAAEAAAATKRAAYREMLEGAGIAPKHIAAILKVADVNGVEIGEDGKIANTDDVAQSITNDWAGFIPATKTAGVDTPAPPANTGGNALTKDAILGIKDTAERQKAIAENHELFGF